MTRKHTPPQTIDEFENLSSELAIAVWNSIAQLPQFRELHPRDFSLIYEAVQAEMKRLRQKSIRRNGR